MGFIERLRQEAELEAAAKEAAEQSAQQRMRTLKATVQRLLSEQPGEVDAAKRFLQESAFPGLLSELGRLRSIARHEIRSFGDRQISWHVHIPDRSRMTRDLGGGDYKYLTGLDYRRTDFDWGTARVGILVNIGEERRGLLGHYYLNFLILYDPLGNINVIGRRSEVLHYSQWKDSPNIQEDALERAFINPGKLYRSKKYESTYIYNSEEHPGG